jgi:putative flippase GtrA
MGASVTKVSSPSRGIRRALPLVALAGLLAWVVDASVLWVVSSLLGLPVFVGAATGFILAGVVNFLLNRRTFAGSASASPKRRYTLLFVVNLALVTTLVPAIAALISSRYPDVHSAVIMSKVVVTAIMLPINTFLYERWVFSS